MRLEKAIKKALKESPKADDFGLEHIEQLRSEYFHGWCGALKWVLNK